MRFRFMSDLHLECSEIDLPNTPDEHETILLLAGDICNVGKRSSFTGFFQEMTDRFKEVIYVFGNHEFYDSSLDRGPFKFRQLLELDCMDRQRKYPSNLWRLEDSTFDDLDGITILGSTLWTNYRNGNPVIMNHARAFMNDYAYIRIGGDGYDRRIRPEDLFDINYKSTNYLFDQIKIEREKGRKVVVVTHHAPTHESVDPKYGTGDENEFYANHFDYRLMNDEGPDVWVSGHIHSACDYTIGKTRVLCNPRGYQMGIYSETETGFDPYKEFVL